MTILAGSNESTPFGAAAAVHTAYVCITFACTARLTSIYSMLSHNDVTNITIPLGLYPSQDEPVDEVSYLPLRMNRKDNSPMRAVEADPRDHFQEADRR